MPKIPSDHKANLALLYARLAKLNAKARPVDPMEQSGRIISSRPDPTATTILDPSQMLEKALRSTIRRYIKSVQAGNTQPLDINLECGVSLDMLNEQCEQVLTKMKLPEDSWSFGGISGESYFYARLSYNPTVQPDSDSDSSDSEDE